jgi:hypothetical protein
VRVCARKFRSDALLFSNCRIEDERRDVNEMKQEMETLQAMVIAQTAQLAIKQESVGEMGRALKELDLQKVLLKQAEERAEAAIFEKERTRSQLESLKAQNESQRAHHKAANGARLEHDILVQADPNTAEKIARLEKENIRLKVCAHAGEFVDYSHHNHNHTHNRSLSRCF